MTGRALFNEVFLEEAWVIVTTRSSAASATAGAANTTLMFERAGLGAGGGSGAASSPPAPSRATSIRAGDSCGPAVAAAAARPACSAPVRRACLAGAGRGKASDPSIRQKLMKLHTLGEVARMNNLRLKAAMAAKRDIPGLPNIAKLTMSEMVRQSRDLGLEIAAMAPSTPMTPTPLLLLDEATGMPWLAGVTEAALFAQDFRPSTAAPTRSSGTSMASGSSASPRSRASTRTRPTRTCPRTVDPRGLGSRWPSRAGGSSGARPGARASARRSGAAAGAAPGRRRRAWRRGCGARGAVGGHDDGAQADHDGRAPHEPAQHRHEGDHPEDAFTRQEGEERLGAAGHRPAQEPGRRRVPDAVHQGQGEQDPEAERQRQDRHDGQHRQDGQADGDHQAPPDDRPDAVLGASSTAGGPGARKPRIRPSSRVDTVTHTAIRVTTAVARFHAAGFQRSHDPST